MLTYLIRRHLPAVLLAPLIVYTLIPSMPARFTTSAELPCWASPRDHSQVYMRANCPGIVTAWRVWKLHSDKPWPLNYIAYIFTPGESTYVDGYDNVVVTKGMDANIFGWHLRGAGVLTGDFGRSFRIGRNIPVSELFSPDLDKLFSTMFALLFSVTLVAAIQQLRRARVYLPPGKRLLTAAEGALRLTGYRQARFL